MSETAKVVPLTVDKNPFALEGRRDSGGGGMVQVASSRQAQEVQGMMVLAKKFPRNEEAAYSRIMQACKRTGLAESALYSYPKGGQMVSGPSIRLAEAMAQNWGNLDFGILELEQGNGESTVMAYCVDLETNTRQTKVFQVPHERKANGSIKKLDDPRDIYELVANQGARRLRSCILGIIPGDIIDSAVEQVEKTLKGNSKEPLIDRVRKMVLKFQEDFQVTPAMIEKKLGHKLDAISETEIVKLGKMYNSIRDGFSKREDLFSLVDSPEPSDATTPAQTPATEQPGQTQAAPAANETIGTKQSRTKKQTSAPAPADPAPTAQGVNTRETLIQTVERMAAEAGITNQQMLNAIYKTGFAPAGTMLTQMPSDMLSGIITDWRAVLAAVE